MRYFDYIIIVSLAVYAVSAFAYCALALWGHKLPRKLDYKLQDAAMVGMSFVVLAVIAAIIRLIFAL